MKSEKDKVTPWFDGNIKPVREGVYERHWGEWAGKQAFSLFKNGVWWFVKKTPNAAVKSYEISTRQSIPWRGLAKDPKG